jgi:hypothetical protein
MRYLAGRGRRRQWKWQAAILKAEETRPKLRLISAD